MQKKNSKGITLMTLMITIIILIILASVATYSGIHVINSSKLTAFTTEMKIMQTQVNSLYQKWKNGETIEVEETKYTGDDIVNNLGQVIDNNIQSNLVFTGDASGITNKEGYKYYSKELIKSLGIEGVRQEFFINIEKRSVISYKGLKYEGQMYYTLNQLPKGLYNVENENNDIAVPIFTVRQNLIAKDKWKIIIEDIKYEGNINKWQVQYKLEAVKEWRTTENLDFVITEEGFYDIKIKNGEIESEVKTIMLLKEEKIKITKDTEGTLPANTQINGTETFINLKM